MLTLLTHLGITPASTEPSLESVTRKRCAPYYLWAWNLPRGRLLSGHRHEQGRHASNHGACDQREEPGRGRRALL